ncbi:hypothetical protein IP78_05775, partial [Brevundimonas sp. AAP58]|uniref:hypothetical protein n=1 Tax=Brevundimonas sp. AAP58 TaxID=1523422 RepID=UPI0006CE20A9
MAGVDWLIGWPRSGKGRVEHQPSRNLAFVIPGGGSEATRDPEQGGAGAKRRRNASADCARDSFALSRAALF